MGPTPNKPFLSLDSSLSLPSVGAPADARRGFGRPYRHAHRVDRPEQPRTMSLPPLSRPPASPPLDDPWASMDGGDPLGLALEEGASQWDTPSFPEPPVSPLAPAPVSQEEVEEEEDPLSARQVMELLHEAYAERDEEGFVSRSVRRLVRDARLPSSRVDVDLAVCAALGRGSQAGALDLASLCAVVAELAVKAGEGRTAKEALRGAVDRRLRPLAAKLRARGRREARPRPGPLSAGLLAAHSEAVGRLYEAVAAAPRPVSPAKRRQPPRRPSSPAAARYRNNQRPAAPPPPAGSLRSDRFVEMLRAAEVVPGLVGPARACEMLQAAAAGGAATPREAFDAALVAVARAAHGRGGVGGGGASDEADAHALALLLCRFGAESDGAAAARRGVEKESADDEGPAAPPSSFRRLFLLYARADGRPAHAVRLPRTAFAKLCAHSGVVDGRGTMEAHVDIAFSSAVRGTAPATLEQAGTAWARLCARRFPALPAPDAAAEAEAAFLVPLLEALSGAAEAAEEEDDGDNVDADEEAATKDDPCAVQFEPEDVAAALAALRKYERTMRGMFSRFSRAHYGAGAGAAEGAHAARWMGLEGLTAWCRHAGVCPSYVTLGDVKRTFLETAVRRRPPHAPALSFDRFLLSLVGIATAAFSGGVYRDEYPSALSRVELLLFSVKEVGFRGFSSWSRPSQPGRHETAAGLLDALDDL